MRPTHNTLIRITRIMDTRPSSSSISLGSPTISNRQPHHQPQTQLQLPHQALTQLHLHRPQL
jgi:hypothetical protein